MPAVRRVTIADVAADAGVGVGTVSRVLNGSEQVRESTLRAVLDSIDRLGYRPSHAAAALVRGTPRTVALIVAHLTRPSTVVRVASALAVLQEQGYDAIVYNVDSPLERDRHLETLLPTHRADGVLAVCLPLSRDQLDQFARAGVALVGVDEVNPGVPQTVIDDVAGGRLATGHLIALGHRRIGFVGDMPFSRPPAGLGFTSSAKRLRGYKQALAAAGIRVEPGLIRRGPHDAATAAEHAARLLKSPDPPSAIFAASDTQAIGVLAAADRLGVAIPERLSVVGFDDIESAAFLDLSTVRQPLAVSGAEGARRLCALLRGEKVTRPDDSKRRSRARGAAAEVTRGAGQFGGGAVLRHVTTRMTDEVPLAGHADDHALALQHFQGPGGHPVRDVMMLGDGVDRGDPAGEGPLRDLVSQHLRDLLIRRYRRVRVDHMGQLSA